MESRLRALTVFALLVGLTKLSQAAVSISFSTSAPVTLQNDFIAATTSQFISSVTKNWLFAGTDKVVISGKNPNYIAPIISTTILTLDYITTQLKRISSNTYVYGWGSGMEYERASDLNMIQGYQINCSSAPYFKSSTMTWNTNVCVQVLNTIYKSIYDLSFSTPTLFQGY